ncbi:MAG: type II toxin-antitoxin system VapC family toxin [Crinalium sp.]
MTKIVVDANVAIKLVLPEIHSSEAWRLRNINYELLVPDFFFPEIGNILWKRVRRGEMTLDDAKNDLAALSALPWQVGLSLSLMPLALEIATRVDQAVYDCVYLALAVTNNCQMVTADERFYNALSKDSLFSHLCWIENLP